MTRVRRLGACALVAFACAVAALAIAPSIFGYRAYTVLSGSMRPAIAPGAVVVTKDVPVTAVHRGDIVTLSTPNGTRLVTHRVESLRNTPTGVDVTTRGDANSRDEHWLVAPAGRVQRVVLRVGELGYLGAFLREPLVVLLLLLPALWFVLRGLLRRRRAIENQPVALGVPLALGAVVLAGLSLAAGTYATFTAATSNASTLSSAADWTAPTITRAVIERTDTDTGAGYIKQAQAYYVYAYVTDSGNPTSGVSTVTANVGNVTAGQTAVSLSSGSWTINGLAYNYRSGSKTADNPLAEGATSYSVTAVDGASNSTTNSSLSVTVDNTAPATSRSVIQDTGGGTAGTILPGASYYVYAQVADTSSGIDTVTADVSSVTSGQTAVALSTSGGPWTVGGLSYNYRSASKTADASGGSKSYSVTGTDNVANSTTDSSFSLTITGSDSTPPTISLGIIERTDTDSGAGYLHQNQAYYVYAEVADVSGVSSVAADVSAVTVGQTAVSLSTSGGPWSVNGQSYNYRSASQTADNPLAEGSKSYSISATDTLANNGSTNFTVWIDNTAPSVSLATSATNHAYFSASTMYYKGDTTGSFTLQATVSDATSGPASTTFPAIATTGWTHGSETVTGSSPYTSSSYSWTASPNNPASYTVTAVDAVGNSGSATAVSFASDTTPPNVATYSITSANHAYLDTGGGTYALNYKGNTTGGFALQATLYDDLSGGATVQFPDIATTGWTHAGETQNTIANVATSSSFSWTANPTSIFSAYVVTITDQVGNSASGASISFASDTIGPSITIGTQTRNGAIYRSADTTMYYKGNATGNFTLRATPTDILEPASTVTFPDISTTGWTHTSENVDTTNNVAAVSSSFSWTANPNNPTSYTVSATDSVGNVGTATISFVSDTTGPTVSLATGSTNHAYLNVGSNTMFYKGNTTGSFTLQAALTDGGAGVTGGATSASFPDISTTGWTHSNETVTSSTPVTSSSFSYTTSPNNPSSYTVTATDAVGNSTTATAITFTSDTTGPSITHNALSGATRAYLNTGSTTMYYKGDSTGNFTLAPSVSDAGSGAASATFPSISTTGWTHSNETQNVSAGVATSSSFSWTASPNVPSSYTVTATDNVGNTTNATAITFTSDTTGPAITHNALSGATRAYLNTGSTTMYYKGDSTGNFTLAPSVSDAGSGAASATFPSISTTGWTHSNETQNVSAGVATSSSFSWTASPNVPSSYTVTATDNVGNTTNATAITFSSDTTGPAISNPTLTSASNASISTTTVAYVAATTGSFKFSTGMTDASAGISKLTYPAIATTGWTHSTEDVTGSTPYVSSTFSWTASPTNPTGYTLTATDNVGNTSTLAITFAVDATPAASSVATVDNGGHTGKIEQNDTVTFTFSAAMNPASILSGWNGSSTSMYVRVTHVPNNDNMTFFDSGNTTQLNLGQLNFNRGDYGNNATVRTFNPSTMVMSGNTITITLGTASGTVQTASQSSILNWAPSTSATSALGTAMSSTNWNASSVAFWF